MTDTARVIRFKQIGDESVLEFHEETLQQPKAGELRIKVAAIGLNRAELMFRDGQYPETPEFPSRIGYEASGVVDAIGDGVTGFKLGDKVSTIPAFSMSQYGVYGESATVPATAVAKYPESLTPVEGTAIWMQYLTAYGALIGVGDLTAGQTLLVTAASSSVGVAAIQIAKSLGAKVIATTRGQTKISFLQEIGADHVVDTQAQNLAEAVMEITQQQGAQLIFDPVAGPMLETLSEAAAPGATIIEYGALDLSAPTPYPLFSTLVKGLTIRGYILMEVTTNPERLSQGIEFVNKGLASGALKPIIDKVFTFNDMQAAHKYMASNQQKGKIVVEV